MAETESPVVVAAPADATPPPAPTTTGPAVAESVMFCDGSRLRQAGTLSATLQRGLFGGYHKDQREGSAYQFFEQHGGLEVAVRAADKTPLPATVAERFAARIERVKRPTIPRMTRLSKGAKTSKNADGGETDDNDSSSSTTAETGGGGHKAGGGCPCCAAHRAGPRRYRAKKSSAATAKGGSGKDEDAVMEGVIRRSSKRTRTSDDKAAATASPDRSKLLDAALDHPTTSSPAEGAALPPTQPVAAE